MRPLRLELEGFTSFRQRVVLDFSSLDLFAITGPTGAGKSSLIDAMIFALYGQVPRVGREYRQLLSHGAERLAVQLDFHVGAHHYRLSRTARRSDGRVHVRLERLGNGDVESLAGSVREIEEQIDRIVGLDYEAFTRSVVLPQGQFDLFLKGRPEERRRILVALLNLGIYEQMHRIANRHAAEAGAQAQFIANQLATEYADATPETLATRRQHLGAIERERAAAAVAVDGLAEGLRLARAVRMARRDLETVTADITVEFRREKAARDRLADAERTRAALDERRRDLDGRLAAAPFDEDRYLALLGAKPLAEQLARVGGQLGRLEAQVRGRQDSLAIARRRMAESAATKKTVDVDLERTQDELAVARGALDALRRQHAAHELRQHLRPGERCPVCAQTAGRVPRSRAPAMDAAEKTVAGAENSWECARGRREELLVKLEGIRRDVRAAERELDQLGVNRRELEQSLVELTATLATAGVTRHQTADPGALVARLEEELQRLSEARDERAKAETARQDLERELITVAPTAAAARAEAAAARARIEELENRRQAAAKVVKRKRVVLLALAERDGWTDVEQPPTGHDEVDVLESRSEALQGRIADLSGQQGRIEAEIRDLEAKIARGAELGERQRSLQAQAALAAVLAQHLQANQFVAYMQEEALRVLSEDGSRRLKTLSQGRYSLTCESQDFFVIDHWNADETRSAKTLSGGESFLASLALALALAERVAELSAEGRAGQSLESLFLDEGFGTLDAETLDMVVQGIEALHGGQRMVAVVTHIPELAERMPSRVAVVPGGAGATISVR